jgi:hypothetical protein
MTYEERAQSLENAFFHEVDKKLLEDLRQQIQTMEARKALQEASGIQDESLVAKLVDIGVRPATLSAVALIPLVATAWANGKLDAEERRAVLKAEQAAGIAADSPTQQLLEAWLQSRPDDKLLEAWEHYVSSLRGKLSEEMAVDLEGSLLPRVKAVAKASGGYFTYGSVSPSESKTIRRIKTALKQAK